MSSDRNDPENKNENSASKILPRPCLAWQAPGTYIFLFFVGARVSKKLRKDRDRVARGFDKRG